MLEHAARFMRSISFAVISQRWSRYRVRLRG